MRSMDCTTAQRGIVRPGSGGGRASIRPNLPTVLILTFMPEETQSALQTQVGNRPSIIVNWHSLVRVVINRSSERSKQYKMHPLKSEKAQLSTQRTGVDFKIRVAHRCSLSCFLLILRRTCVTPAEALETPFCASKRN